MTYVKKKKKITATTRTWILWQESSQLTEKDSVLASLCCSNKQPQTLRGLQKRLCISLFRHMRAGGWLWFCYLSLVSLASHSWLLISRLGLQEKSLGACCSHDRGAKARGTFVQLLLYLMSVLSLMAKTNISGAETYIPPTGKNSKGKEGTVIVSKLKQSPKDVFLNISTI